jgi:hypothetical protein
VTDFFFYSLWGETEYLGTAVTTGLLYQPQMTGDGDRGEIGGMKICRGNRSTRRQPAHTVYLCVPYGSHSKERLFP